MRKFSSALFLGLLLLNMAGQSLLTFWSSWEMENTIASNIKIENNTLIHKNPISLPYSGNFENKILEGQMAIFEGKFFQIQKVEYINDTLVSYYSEVNLSRENFLSIAKNFNENQLEDFSNEPTRQSKKALELLKKISSEFISSRKMVLTAWFWTYDAIQIYYFETNKYFPPQLSDFVKPPVLLA